MKNTYKAGKETDPESPNFTEPQVDPEEAKKNMQLLLAARRKEIDERKKDDDAGCNA
jgi:hypothetical protein